MNSDYKKKSLQFANQTGVLPAPSANCNLVGHSAILNQFCAQYCDGTLHHAWIISGPRGIGKETLAFHIASHILRHPDFSAAPKTYSPEDRYCSVRAQLSSGIHPNCLCLSRPWSKTDKRFLSELTVTEIRRTIPFFSTTASQKAWRICIVDCIDDMNRNAANALLKILEEPPRFTLFLLLNHSPGKLPATLKSRCQTVFARPLSSIDMQKVLNVLSIGKVEERDNIIKLSTGSVRKAALIAANNGLEMYEKMQRLLGKHTKENTIIENHHIIDWPEIHAFANHILAKHKEDYYTLFTGFAFNLISNYAHDLIYNNICGCAKKKQNILAGLTELWEKTLRSIQICQDYNLDRKQVILDFFQNYYLLKK